MTLFNNKEIIELLPHDGEAVYYGKVFDQQQSQFYLDKLLNEIVWKNDEAVIFGRRIITKRKVAWHADKDYTYTYSKTTKHALPWTKEYLELKKEAEEISGATYNSCLLNLYHDGDEGMAWHSDDEKALIKNGTIASLSFGAERKFMFKHKRTGQTVSLILENGSLLTMQGVTQTHWMHRLTKSAKIKSPRVNLTFRTVNAEK